MTTVLLVSALLVGSLLAVQASANLQLNKAVGTPYGASTLQLWLAAVLLTVLAVATGQVGALAHVLDVPAWFLFGGLASPLYITSGILLFPRVGALAAAGLFVTGQTLASIVLDVFGLLGLEQRPVSVGILAGSTAVIAGITVIIRGQRPVAAASSPAPASVGGTAGVGAIATPPMTPAVGLPPAGAPSRGGAGSPGWVGLGLLAGAALPIQGAINARLRAELEQPIAVGLVSFVVAAWAISTVLAALLLARRTSRPRLAPLRGMPWWGWLGGACAASYVTGTFLLLPAIGAAVTVALTVTGQQLASAVIDSRGLFRLPRRRFTRTRMIGLALLIAGSLLVLLL